MKGDQQREPRTAVLVRRRCVDVGDVSRKGCRVMAREPLTVGQVGMLIVDIGGLLHVEVFRVSRTRPGPGVESRYEAGVEFLPMPGAAPSLQDVAAALEDSVG